MTDILALLIDVGYCALVWFVGREAAIEWEVNEILLGRSIG